MKQFLLGFFSFFLTLNFANADEKIIDCTTKYIPAQESKWASKTETIHEGNKHKTVILLETGTNSEKFVYKFVLRNTENEFNITKTQITDNAEFPMYRASTASLPLTFFDDEALVEISCKLIPQFKRLNLI